MTFAIAARCARTGRLGVAISTNPIGVGGSATGSATLTNVLPTAGGTVTYTVYANSTCTTPVTPALSSTKTVTLSLVPNSGPFIFSQAGAFYWKAVYSGDTLNAGDAEDVDELGLPLDRHFALIDSRNAGVLDRLPG